jgi:hypothetical protein
MVYKVHTSNRLYLYSTCIFVCYNNFPIVKYIFMDGESYQMVRKLRLKGCVRVLDKESES